MTQAECDALAAAIADLTAQIDVKQQHITEEQAELYLLIAERGAKQGAYNAGCPPHSPPPPPPPPQ